MKHTKLLIALLSVFVTTSSAFGLSLTLENQSEWTIHELYFSPSDEKSWGPDQLGEEVVIPGESFELRKISKGEYDVRIVDEDGDACVIPDVDFRASEHFELTDKILLGCQANTEE